MTRSVRLKVGVAASTVLLAALLATLLSPPASSAVTWTGGAQAVYDPGDRRYSYAPSAISRGGESYYYTCHNNIDDEVKDHVYFTQVNSAGQPPQQSYSVLQGTPGAWDSNHVCDPSVVRGDFTYSGNTYDYAMFYLGTDYPNSRNQIGVAFSDDLGGPWFKYPQPIVTTPLPDPNQWGVGQPSVTTVDAAAGRVLLFYGQDDNITTGGTRADYDSNKLHVYRRDLVLGDMSNPIIGPAVAVTEAGLVGTDGNPDKLHNFDVAYSPSRDRFYVARERYPFPTNDPWYVSTEVEVVSIPGSSIWEGGGSWTVEGRITPAMTGFERNHNPGVLRSIYGSLPDEDSLTTVFTRSDTGAFPGTLWTYDLYSISGPLS